MRTCFLHGMFAYDMTFDPRVFRGHCDLILWFISQHSIGIFSYFFQITNESDPIFNLNVLIGHYDLFHCSVISLYISTLNGYMIIFLSHE